MNRWTDHWRYDKRVVPLLSEGLRFLPPLARPGDPHLWEINWLRDHGWPLSIGELLACRCEEGGWNEDEMENLYDVALGWHRHYVLRLELVILEAVETVREWEQDLRTAPRWFQGLTLQCEPNGYAIGQSIGQESDPGATYDAAAWELIRSFGITTTGDALRKEVCKEFARRRKIDAEFVALQQAVWAALPENLKNR